ncbi:hypothetical protein C8Q80DRAFT_1274986 [Daedaleopsis nitida]|nr:hypothetical protein C8Q80DRAFT_1274986 [Daedaleopsis nitida]
MARTGTPEPSVNLTPRPHKSRGGSRIRLPKQAYEILNDYYLRTNTFPTDSQRTKLAETIKAIPGCEHYTPRHVYAYFGNMRAKARSGKLTLRVTSPSGLSRLSVEPSENDELEPEMDSRGTRIRLPEHACEILNDFYLRISTFPTDTERAELAATIKAIPGCERYTPQHVYAYFGTMRAKARRGKLTLVTSPSGSPSTSVEPSDNDELTQEQDSVEESTNESALSESTDDGPRDSPMDHSGIDTESDRTSPGQESQTAGMDVDTPMAGCSRSPSPIQVRTPSPLYEAPLTPENYVYIERERQCGSLSRETSPFTFGSPLLLLGLPCADGKRLSTRARLALYSPLTDSDPTSALLTYISPPTEVRAPTPELCAPEPGRSSSSSDGLRTPASRCDSDLDPALARDFAIFLRQALAAPARLYPGPGARPRTFAELARWFEQQDLHASFTAFLSDVERGVYAHLGLAPVHDP